MASLVAKGADWLISQAHEIEKAAATARVKIGSIESRVRALQAREARIADVTKRAAARRDNAKLLASLQTARKGYDKFAAQYRAGKAKAVEFLRAHNLLSGSGLGEIGVLPVAVVIPIALVATFTAAWIAVKWVNATAHALDLQTTAREKKQAKDEQIDKDVAAGRVTPEQAAKQKAENQRQFEAETRTANEQKPTTDPLGVTTAIEAAVPLVLIIAGIVLMPRILDTFTRSRTRGYVANPPRRRRRHRSRAWVAS